MNGEIVIDIKNISKKFGQELILHDISLQCRTGHIYGFTGHNGCGKTVLFKCILGFLQLSDGKITVNGEEIGKEVAKGIGFIIEQPAFIKRYSGRKNLKLLYMLNHKTEEHKITEYMKLVGLDPMSRKNVGQYSLGMRQRLAIAQAIMENQKILILDEPMNGLDKKGVEQIRTLLLEYKRQGRVILLASHNPKDIDILCDEIYEFENGTIKRVQS